jgi:F-type H+/Na+-transporting ATPase subunit alpha
VSRVGGNAQVNAMKKVAGRLKIELSQYRDLEAFAQFGSDLDADTQRTLARGERLVKMLNQNERAPLPVAVQVVQVYAGTNGYLDRIDVDRVPEFLDGLTQRLHSESSDVLEKLSGGDWSDETQEQVKKSVSEFAEDFGFDLDEEGQPLDPHDDKPRSRSEESKDDDSEKDGSGNGQVPESATESDDDDEDASEKETEEEATPA